MKQRRKHLNMDVEWAHVTAVYVVFIVESVYILMKPIRGLIHSRN